MHVYCPAVDIIQMEILGVGFCARPRPKGLPYIIHYALAHQASLSGVTPRELSSLACHLVANCWSKGDKSCSPPLHALIALRGGWGAPFWLGGTLILVAECLCGWFWHRMSRAELNGVSVSSVSFQLQLQGVSSCMVLQSREIVNISVRIEPITCTQALYLSQCFVLYLSTSTLLVDYTLSQS